MTNPNLLSQFYLLLLLAATAIADDSKIFDQPQVVHPANENRYPQFSEFYFNVGYSLEPAPQKKEKGGEDSLLASKRIIAVSDGVGGWASQGIDPSKYSLNLVKNVEMYFDMLPRIYSERPKNLLKMAASTNPFKGSATLVICTLWKNQLRGANLGDSGFAILGPRLKTTPDGQKTYIYDYRYISPPQQHTFNFPYQLGNDGRDESVLAAETTHTVGFGDIVIVYSDGISDNVFPGQMRQLLNFYIYGIKQKFGIQVPDIVRGFNGAEFAEILKNFAFEKSRDKQHLSPFGLNGLEFGVLFKGGKSDDISVVSAILDRVPKEEMTKIENIEKNEDSGQTEEENGSDDNQEKMEEKIEDLENVVDETNKKDEVESGEAEEVTLDEQNESSKNNEVKKQDVVVTLEEIDKFPVEETVDSEDLSELE